MYKVERKPASCKAKPYEVMLSPFSTLDEVKAYIEKYKKFYPQNERTYIITELDVP